MAPLLIDGRDLLKLGFIAVLVTLLTFFAGFLAGHEKAVTTYHAGSETQALSLPSPVLVADESVISRAPEKVEAGSEIDVDQPVVNSFIDEKVSKKSVSMSGQKDGSSEPFSELLTKNVKSSGSADQSTKQSVKPQVLGIANAKEISLDEEMIVSVLSHNSYNNAKYTIQVGVYGQLVNAENMMKMLQAQKFDAYVTDYKNKNNKTRYNVRLGYFADKKSALEKLKEFKNSQKGDGYLVNFSADNIVKTANAEELKQVPDTPIFNDDVNQDPAPIVVPSEVMLDNVSQADISDSLDLLSNHSGKTN